MRRFKNIVLLVSLHFFAAHSASAAVITAEIHRINFFFTGISASAFLAKRDEGVPVGVHFAGQRTEGNRDASLFPPSVDEAVSADVVVKTQPESPQGEPAAGEDEAKLFANSVSEGELDKSRGAFTPDILNASDLTASSINNTVNGGVTGANKIDTQAFGNVGIGAVIQNTGNNVVIQSATIVNLNLQQ